MEENVALLIVQEEEGKENGENPNLDLTFVVVNH
jgi:hypothetical protein